MKRLHGAVLASGLIVMFALAVASNPRVADDALKFIVGTVYQHFAADPLPHQYVDQLAAQRDADSARVVKLQGYAVAIERRGNRADFRLERNGHAVRVSYAGPMPSGFVEGNEVVVTGELTGKGDLYATQLAARLAR